MLDVLRLARRLPDQDAGGFITFEVSGDDLYPATLDHIAAMIKAGAARPPDPLGLYWDKAIAAPAQAWVDARAPGEALPRDQRSERAALLEAARLWFTEALHATVGGALALYIRRGEGNRWKL